MAIPSNVQNAINNGYDFRFGDYISRGFQLVQKNVGLFIAGTFVFFLIISAMSMVSTAIGGALAILGGLAGILANQLISQVISAAVAGPLTAGFYQAANKSDTDKPLEFGDFFAGFSKWTALFTTTIMTALVVLVASVPGIYLLFEAGLDFTALQGPRAMEVFEDIDWSSISLGAIVALIPAIYLTVSYAWAPMLTWFYDIQGWEALETSRKLAAKNFLPLFGLVCVLGIIMLLGVLLLCVGVLFTFPVYAAGIYASFADAVGLNRNNSPYKDDVIDHFAPNV